LAEGRWAGLHRVFDLGLLQPDPGLHAAGSGRRGQLPHPHGVPRGQRLLRRQGRGPEPSRPPTPTSPGSSMSRCAGWASRRGSGCTSTTEPAGASTPKVRAWLGWGVSRWALLDALPPGRSVVLPPGAGPALPHPDWLP
ncbi:unnamed protein product, partial [Tetraodon nigroviridis]